MDTEDTYMYQRNPDDQGPTPRQRLHNQGDDTNGNDPGKKKMSPSGLMFVIIALAVILGAGYLFLACQASTMNSQPVGELPYSSLYQQVMSGNIENAIFQGQDITGTFRKPIQLMDTGGNSVVASQFHVIQIPNGDPNLIPLLNTYHVQFQAKPVADNTFLGVVFNFLPLILVFGVVFLITRRSSRGQQNVFSFGKTRAKVVLGERPGTKFADVAGVDEAKNDLVEVVEFLKTPYKFSRLGGRIPRGVLRGGPPGPGKTLPQPAASGSAG